MRLLPRVTVAVGIGAILAFAAAAQTPPPAPAPQAARESVPLRLANRTVFEFRAPAGGYAPADRAAGAQRRLEEALPHGAVGKVTTKSTSEGVIVSVDDKLIFFVTPGDVSEPAGETLESVAARAVQALEQAIVEHREHTSARFLALAVGLAGLATLIWVAILRALFVFDRWAGRRVGRAVAAHVQRLEVKGVKVLDPAHFLSLARRLFAAILWIVGLGATYGWLVFVLERFPYTRPWGEQLAAHLLDLAAFVGGSIVGAVPGLLLVVVVFFIARLVIKALAAFFDRVEDGRLSLGWLDADTARPTRQIVNLVIWLFALAMAYPYLPGAQTDAFKGVSVLVGLMVSIGASSIVGQAASGLILMYTRVYRAGEYVRIADSEGTLMELGLFTTRVRTGLGEEIVLPNSFVLQNTTKNYSRAVQGTGFVLDTTVTIGYSTPWRQVHAMLEEAARRTPDIAASPAPYVRQTALSDFYVEYRLVAYTAVERPPQRADVLNQLHANIQDIFNEHGVQIMSPHYMTDPAGPQIVPKARWHLAPARPPAATGGSQAAGS
jgi:small-conductance mechanosensitive channel